MERKQVRKKAFKSRSYQSDEFNLSPHHPSNETSPLINRMITNPKHLSHEDILHMQSDIGNKATMQLMAQSGQSSATIQRRINPIAGQSSGWFRKGRRDKLNVMVGAYNIQENKSANTIPANQALQAEVQKIRKYAEDWKASVQSKSPEKGEEIATWIKTELDREETAKGAAIGQASLDDAWKNTGYDERFSTPKYTEAAAMTWLNTPELANVYRYYVINKQFDAATMNAYDDMQAYAKNPTRDEAIRIYNAYSLKDASTLNITGEGVGGIGAINAVRSQFSALINNPDAPVPPDFGAIQRSNVNVLSEIFTAFSNSDEFKRITTKPDPKKK